MSNAVGNAVQSLLDGDDLSADRMQAAVGEIMDGETPPSQIAALLTALRMKGETVEEITGAARAMIDRCTPIGCSRTGLLDTCGTGGDGLHTFNISTATALLVAAGGVPVAKHGNRSVSSSSGSADVLKALGIRIELEPEQVARCIDELGIGFCFAPLVHGAMKYAAPVRRELGFRTIFNLLGPLTNPAAAEYQLLGANSPKSAEMLANALAQLGRSKQAIVVCGNGELDEVSLWGDTSVWLVDGSDVLPGAWNAGMFGLPECRPEELTVQSPEESAAVIRSVLEGQEGAAKDIVMANAAAAFLTAGKVFDLESGTALADKTISEGDAMRLLERFAELTHGL